MNPGYYAIIPANVRYDSRLKPNAKLLYGEITALSNKEGFCWAKNEYFADLYKLSERNIQRLICNLKDAGYLEIKIDQTSINTRKIYLKNLTTKMSDLTTKMSPAHDKNVTTTIYSINNTINTAESALNFVLKNYPIRFEQEFLMEYEKQFKNQGQFDNFLKDFNDEAEIKDKAFGGWLIAMMKKYVRNWLKSKKSVRVISMNEPTALSKKEVI